MFALSFGKHQALRGQSPTTRKDLDMTAFYTQKADQILPIFGVSSIDEARDYVAKVDHASIVATDEVVYMNPVTGSVDFANGWDSLGGLLAVEYCSITEAWVEV